MVEVLTLDNGTLSASIAPSLGASIVRFDHVAGGARVPLFRPATVGPYTKAFDLACQVLVPWSNRISNGGFSFDGVRHALAPNIEGELSPNHGNGFAQPWSVVNSRPRSLSLRLHSQGPGPYCYEAELSYALVQSTLSMRLHLRNTGAATLPFGMGFHPWIVRTPSTLLCARAKAVWLEDRRHLPVGSMPVDIPQAWDFARPAALPPGFINNAFVQWDRKALVQWPDRHLEMAIQASPALSTCIIYAPSAAADFFCFEPVSHPVDAFNMADMTSSGVVILRQGEWVGAGVEFSARQRP